MTFELELEGLVGVAVGRGKMAFLAEGRAWTKDGKQPRMVASGLLFSLDGFLLSLPAVVLC